ncbi:MAG: peptidase S8 [Flavobacteriaceae bacterium]|uniref:reprolysin-like metallopeptidase n=1 Tax=Bizionia echini TaxID=649333 RepID=UPI000C90AB32|nr:peptidase S8 [Flavobacteriaceae bacterium]
MIKKLFLLLIFSSISLSFAQSKKLWEKQTAVSKQSVKTNKLKLPNSEVFSLDFNALKQSLQNVAKREDLSRGSEVILSFPNDQGKMERFRVFEASVLHPDLQARFPDIRSYAGQGVDNPADVIRFSMSPKGFQSMRLSPDKPASFIEAYTNDLSQYVVFNRQDRRMEQDDFECTVTDAMNSNISGDVNSYRNADDGLLRTYRLAVSTTGEYTAYHGGTKALALAAINATMTRVNGVFENDFNVTMVVIANNTNVIYTNSGNDPYTSSSNYNSQLQATLTSVIGESNYDVGHLFARASNNGNAGCIGCICVNGQKGSGFTSRTDPEGDPFDIDYVAHEIGHQFGANHTFSFRNESTNAHFEPGSGTTIMGYAGITGATDVQSNSDPYFHAFSIQQVTDYIKSRSCQTNTNTGNAIPTADAGSNYTIPKGTPFVLNGTGTDANSGDVLTYCWEQFDENNAATTYPSTTATSGVAFRSYSPTTDTKRYFPRLATIKTGSTSWQWEAVPNVARTLNFRMTVRDNKAGGAANNSDDMVVTVNGTAGPFIVNSPNSNVTWAAGSTQNVTWNVAGTTGNGVNAANVDIFLSIDGGDTYPITLATNVPNDGSQSVVVPNNQGSQNRIMVKGSNHIFFDISNSNFTIAGQVVCNAAVPSGLNASGVNSNSANLSWNAVSGATYDLRYRQTGTTTWITNNVSGNSTSVSGLSSLTQYEAQVRSKCNGGSNSSYSNSISFTTTDVQLNYCASASTNVNDEYISRVQLNTINNASGAQFYSDFTGISTTLTKGTQYTITVTPTWTGTVYSEGYAVWIDFNRDGDFVDSGELVWSRAATNTTPVSGNFTIPEGAVENATRMRVSMKYNSIPTSCESFTYGEVEDYTVVIQSQGPDIIAPSAPANLSASNTTQTTTDLNWSAATDNIAVTAYDVYQGASIIATVTGTSYAVVGLSASTSYAFSVRAKDAAGNVSVASNTVNVTTLNPPDTQAPSVPANLSATNTTQTSTSLSWSSSTDNVAVTGYDVYQGSTIIASVSGTSRQVTGLTANTAYTFRVRAIDAAGNISGYSNTVNVTTLPIANTGCTGSVSVFPYSEGFENTLGAWTQSTADDTNWTVDANGTPSSNTGPSSAAQGSYYIFVEASSPNYPNKRAILNSPCFDLSAESAATFNFQYHMYGSNNFGTIALEASTNNGTSWASIWNESGNKGNSWQSASVDLAAYVGGTVQLRFNRNVGTTWQADLAIDNISLTTGGGTGGNCNIGNVTLSLTFDNYPEETAWTLKNASGTTVASASYSTSNPDGSTITRTFTGLAAGEYTFTITDAYGDGICCSYGNGSYTLTGSTGTLASGGSFSASETTTFCIQSASREVNETSISQLERDIVLYPNPVKGSVLNIKTTYQDVTYEVFNNLGQLVSKGALSHGTIDVSNLETALYQIRFKTESGSVTKRFIKQ